MANVKGSLMQGMLNFRKTGFRIGVVIIDENVDNPHQAANQKKVIDLARKEGMPIWSVMMNPGFGKAQGRTPTKPTHADLGEIKDDEKIVKYDANVWTSSEPDFEAAVKKAGVNALVIMGRQTQQCVKAAAVGGNSVKKKTFEPGATQRGYLVLTSPQVVNGHVGDVVSWADDPKVICFSELDAKPEKEQMNVKS